MILLGDWQIFTERPSRCGGFLQPQATERDAAVGHSANAQKRRLAQAVAAHFAGKLALGASIPGSLRL